MSKITKLLAVIPAILLLTFINVFITFAVAGEVMLILIKSYPGTYWPLVVSIMVAIGVHCWLVFNHKLRIYIERQGNTDE